MRSLPKKLESRRESSGPEGGFSSERRRMLNNGRDCGSVNTGKERKAEIREARPEGQQPGKGVETESTSQARRCTQEEDPSGRKEITAIWALLGLEEGGRPQSRTGDICSSVTMSGISDLFLRTVENHSWFGGIHQVVPAGSSPEDLS